MKKKETKNRTRKVTIRLTYSEYEQLNNRFKNTTCRKLSDYIRNVLFQGKVTVYTRNQSMDAFMAEMITLRTELNAIGNNFNQAVKKLNSLEKIPEFRVWIIAYTGTQKVLLEKIDFIKSKVGKFSEEWLQ